MKKLLLIAALMFPFVSVADPSHYHHYHEWHEHPHANLALPFLGGLILGGIIAHEMNGHYYDGDDNEVRKVVTCREYPVIDQYGHYVFDTWGHMMIEKRCTESWERVD